jgi:hypothetical protein
VHGDAAPVRGGNDKTNSPDDISPLANSDTTASKVHHLTYGGLKFAQPNFYLVFKEPGELDRTSPV